MPNASAFASETRALTEQRSGLFFCMGLHSRHDLLLTERGLWFYTAGHYLRDINILKNITNYE